MVALQGALAADAFTIAYQPILGVQSRRVEAMEALVRWRHPRYGELLPGRFIGAAERTGVIVPLGMRVLADSCRNLAALRAALPHRADLRLSVNISARQLVDPTLVARLLEVVADAEIAVGDLVLEVTETRLVAQGSRAMAGLGALHRLGVGIAIDDFGTGYSSLAYVKSFPVGAVLKIDRSFVSGLEHDRGDRAVVRAVVGMAGELGLATVAEGVEGATQLAILGELGCDHAQGNHLSPPLPIDLVAAAMDRIELRSRTRWPRAAGVAGG